MPARNLRDGTIKIADSGGTGGANVMTVTLEDGDLTWTERNPAHIISDRGVLDHARLAEEEPIPISFSVIYQSLSTHQAITLYDALTKTGGAAAWVSDEPSSDVYAVILEFTVADPAGGASEVLTFARFIPEEITPSEGSPNSKMQVSGRCVITAPAIS